MRVLLITDTHRVTGGAEIYFFDLKKRLQATPGIEVRSLGFDTIAHRNKDSLILKACKSNMAKLFWRFFVHPFLFLQIRQYVREFKPDIIHLHNVKQYPATLFLALRHYSIVQTVHDYSLLCPMGYYVHRDFKACATGFSWRCFWQHRIKQSVLGYLLRVLALKKMQKDVKRAVNAFIAPSPHLQVDLLKHGFKPAQAIPPFLKTAMYQPFSHAKANYFLFAGNLGAHKGITLLLHEFALALKEKSDLVLLIAGTGPDAEKMQKLTQQLHINDHVRFLGWQDDLSPYYQSVGAVIFPSLCIESFGMVVTEAMAAGRAVIGCNRGPTAWLIADEKTGLLFDPAIEGDLAAKLLRLANQPAHAEQLGKAAYNKMITFIDNEKAFTNVLEIYGMLGCAKNA